MGLKIECKCIFHVYLFSSALLLSPLNSSLSLARVSVVGETSWERRVESDVKCRQAKDIMKYSFSTTDAGLMLCDVMPHLRASSQYIERILNIHFPLACATLWCQWRKLVQFIFDINKPRSAVREQHTAPSLADNSVEIGRKNERMSGERKMRH